MNATLLEKYSYKHHLARHETDNADIRIVHGYVYVVKATMEAGTIMFTTFTGAYIETGNGVLTQIRGNSVLR